MAITDAHEGVRRATGAFVSQSAFPGTSRSGRDLQRTFRLILATVWLLDAVLQIQPIMFTPGSDGLSGMLNGAASGNPGWFHSVIIWNTSIIDHQPILTDTLFAGIQFLIAFGIIYKRSCKPALLLSIVWALAVWWFGESAGEIFQGRATPFGGGPGGVLFYAVLAALLWPREGSDEPFVAARAFGVNAAKAIWATVWGLLAALSLVGSARSPQALHDLVSSTNIGEPGWLAHIDQWSETLLLHQGTTMAVLLTIVCLVVAVGVFLRPQVARATIAIAIVVFALIWVAVQNLGGILAGGATDPNSGPLVILLALIYWPLTDVVSTSNSTASEDLVAKSGA